MAGCVVSCEEAVMLTGYTGSTWASRAADQSERVDRRTVHSVHDPTNGLRPQCKRTSGDCRRWPRKARQDNHVPWADPLLSVGRDTKNNRKRKVQQRGVLSKLINSSCADELLVGGPHKVIKLASCRGVLAEEGACHAHAVHAKICLGFKQGRVLSIRVIRE